MDVNTLSAEGQRLVQDVRDIIETARKIVLEKNADELFQNFLWHTRAIDVSGAKQNPDEINPVNADKARRDGQEAVTHLRTLLTLVLTNAEARKLLADFALIGRDLFATGAVKAAEQIRPNQERLSRVDEAAPADTFHTSGGRTTQNPSETPVLEANVAGRTIQQHPHDEFGTGAQIKTEDGNVQSGGQIKDESLGFVDTIKGTGKDQITSRAQAEGEQINSEVDHTDDPGEKKETAKQGFKERFAGYKDQIISRVPQEHRDKVSEHHERVKNFLSDEYFPEERRDQFIFRGKKVRVRIYFLSFFFTI